MRKTQKPIRGAKNRLVESLDSLELCHILFAQEGAFLFFYLVEPVFCNYLLEQLLFILVTCPAISCHGYPTLRKILFVAIVFSFGLLFLNGPFPPPRP